MINLENKNVLIIGGTGSLGKALLDHLLRKFRNVNVRIYSRDEQKQYELSSTLDPEFRSKVDFSIGDVRDRDRVCEVTSGINIVIHAAAMKHLPIAESNPEEAFKTNVLGTQNVAYAAMINNVERVVGLSTDKAVMPISSYGASKLYLEKILVAANSSRANQGTKFCVVRYANVLGSRGSVVPFFNRIKDTREFPITDLNMTRFSLTTEQGINIVMFALDNQSGGEIYIPKAPSYKITTVAEAIAADCKLREIGIRHNEKISELMVSRYEAGRTLEFENCYVVLPYAEESLIISYLKKHGGSRVPAGFEYDSSTNTEWLSVMQLREQIANLK